MGASFLLGFIQSLFQTQWSYTVFPTVASLASVIGSLSVGYCACLTGFRKKWHGILISVFVAVNFSSLACGSVVLGFFPQTFGLAFAVAFLGLFGTVFSNLKRITNRFSAVFSSLPLAILFSALVYSYSELAPFTVFAAMIAGFGYLMIFSPRKQFWVLCLFFLFFSLLLLNVEIYRAISAIIIQSKVVVGCAVEWAFSDFIGHCFGLRSSIFDVNTWFFYSKFMSLALLLISLFLIVFFMRKIFKKGLLELMPCLSFIFVSVSAFLYFRYLVPSPWNSGIGQTWSQFKISEWAGPFCMIFWGSFFIYCLKHRRVYSYLTYFILFVCIIFGTVQNYHFADKRTKPIRIETGYDKASFSLFLALRKFVLSQLQTSQCLYLDLGGRHNKIRQMCTYFLSDTNLGGAWYDDPYFLWLPSSEQMVPLTKCEYMLGFSGSGLSGEKYAAFGNLILLYNLSEKVAVDADTILDMDDFKWKRWPNNLRSNGIEIKNFPPYIASRTLVDAGLTAPLKLEPGVYRLIADVTGRLDGPGNGPGHISLHGKRKLLWIPSGDYTKGATFCIEFNISSEFNGYLSFGLGGWEKGRGHLKLNNLVIEPQKLRGETLN
jgi:hypothetical protein